MNADLKNIVESATGFVLGLFVVEAILKPAIRYYSKKVFAKVDEKLPWLPDFLSKTEDG